MANLTPRAARKLVDQARARQRAPEVPGVAARRIPKTPHIRPGALGRITTDVTARVGSTLGAGTATLLEFVGLTVALTDESVTVLNTTTTVVPATAGNVAQLLFIDGRWFVCVADCPA